METFGEWLQTELNSRGWKQADLSRASGLSRQTISRVITEQRTTPADDTLQAIARALGYPIEEVYRRAKRLPPKRSGERPMVQLLIESIRDFPDEDIEWLRAIALLRRDIKDKSHTSE